MIYLKLFFEFLKIGLFAVGGGMATLPFLQRLSENTGWFPQSVFSLRRDCNLRVYPRPHRHQHGYICRL